MLEFYYDFLDYYFDKREFELLQMDTNSLYIAWSGENIDDLVKLELREEYHNEGKAKFLSTSKYHDRTPGLFKEEFREMRMIFLTSKCFYAEDESQEPSLAAKSRTLCLGKDISKLSVEVSIKHKIQDLNYLVLE